MKRNQKWFLKDQSCGGHFQHTNTKIVVKEHHARNQERHVHLLGDVLEGCLC